MSAPNPAAVAGRSAPGMETYREKATRKFKENPWVPLGALATVGTFIVASVKLRQGESQKFNYWLRMRVAAQGLTIVALVVGTWTLRPKDASVADATATRNDLDVERRRLEKLAREREEFEERLKGAERAEGVEAGLRTRRRVTEPAVAGEPESNVISEGESQNRWQRWFGGRRGPGAGGSNQ